nr:MAG TPA: hypothetical protein [Caudoviricetes sp.]
MLLKLSLFFLILSIVFRCSIVIKTTPFTIHRFKGVKFTLFYKKILEEL